MQFFIIHDLYHYNQIDKVVLDIVEKLDGEKPQKSHRTTIEHAGFFTPAQVLSIGSQLLIFRGTTKVRNSGLGPDPDQSAKNGPE